MKTVGQFYVIETNEYNSKAAYNMFGESRPVVRLLKSEVVSQSNGTEIIIHTVSDSNGILHTIHDKSDFSEAMKLFEPIELEIGDCVECWDACFDDKAISDGYHMSIGDIYKVTDKRKVSKNANSYVYAFQIVNAMYAKDDGKVFVIYNNPDFLNKIEKC